MIRVGMLLLIAAILAGCGERHPAQAAQASNTDPQRVTTAAVESQQLSTDFTLPAQVTPYQMVKVYPKVTGFIEQIDVDRGSRVKKGQVIARLSAPELVAQRSQAEAHIQAAEAQLAAAQAKLASDQGTYQHLASAARIPGVVAGNDLSVAEQTTAADRAQVRAATNNVAAARDALRNVSQLESYLTIRAPFDGIVTERNFHNGALVGPSSGESASPPIVQIQDVSRLRLTVPVPEAYVAGVAEGRKVDFSVPAYPGRSFQAPIARISHNVDQTTRTMAVELDVRTTELQITPGTFASVEWPVSRSYQTLIVPASAITTDLQRTFVIRMRDGKAEWVDVKTGVTTNDGIEVFGQLQPGDKVVRNATDAIRPGTALAESVGAAGTGALRSSR